KGRKYFARHSGDKIFLQGTDLKIALTVGDDALHGGESTVDGRVVGDLGEQGSATDVAAVADRLGPVRGVDHQLHAAVLHAVDDVRTAFEDLVDLDGGNVVFDQITLGAFGCEDLETGFNQVTGHIDDIGLVRVTHRDESGARGRDLLTCAHLGLGECHGEITVEADHFTRRLHFRAK